MHSNNLSQNILTTINYLKTKKKVLFLTTSNRWSGEKGSNIPKSTQLAYFIKEKLQGFVDIEIIEVPKLKIYPCEGNVSGQTGNSCGLRDAMLKNSEFNPSGYHRCWASLNNPDDELWKISKALFQSEVCLIFGSVRWGQANSHYQKVIERLTWIENRHSTLGEDNIVKDIEAGLILFGHNWNGDEVLKTQKQVLQYFGFKTPKELFWNWQFTSDSTQESNGSYKESARQFEQLLSDLN
jgi:multimeric flavodoxin WrbA